MKKQKLLFTAMLLLCSIVANAHDFVVDGIYYSITDATNNTVAVTYQGTSYSEYANEYTGSVTIPESVTYNDVTYSITSIGSFAFQSCTGLTSIIIPSNVTSIGNYAFNGCTSLKDLVINKGETSLSVGYNYMADSGYTGKGLFYDCPLETLYLGRNLSYRTYNPDNYQQGYSPFYSIKTFKSVTIANSVTEIPKCLFYECYIDDLCIEDGESKLSVSYNSSMFNSTSGCFSSSSITTLYLGRDLTYSTGSSYGYSPFYGCTGLKSITLGNSVTSIGEYLFYGCTGFTNIEIPNSVTSIGESAFYGCTGFTSIIIPNSVTSIDTSAFAGCTALMSVINFSELTFTKGATSHGYVAYYAENVINAPNGTIEGDFVFTNIDDTNTLVGYIKSLNFIEKFGGASLNTSNKSWTLTFNANTGDILTFDWLNGKYGSDANTFSVSVDGKNILSDSSGGSGKCEYIFTTDGTHTITASYSSGVNLSASIGNIVLTHTPDTPEEFHDVLLPNNYKGGNYVIADSVFAERIDIKSVEIPESVKGIGENAFNGCTNLASITSHITAEDLYAINSNVFEGVDKNACTLYVPTGDDLIYASTDGWKDFYNIEEQYTPSEITITINQYGSATFCSTYALDFSNVKGLKAYAASSYNAGTHVVTLLRVQTAKRATGLFLMGEPGEYTVPVIEKSNEYTLNMLVGTIRATEVNSTSYDGEYRNFKYTVIGESNTPEFYQFEDGSTLSEYKAYLQLPASLFPAAASKSIGVRFDNGTFTDIEEIENDATVGIYYDLQGRVVENPANGIYILNGKKVLINDK